MSIVRFDARVITRAYHCIAPMGHTDLMDMKDNGFPEIVREAIVLLRWVYLLLAHAVDA